MREPQSNQRGIETDVLTNVAAVIIGCLNRTSVGLKRKGRPF